MRPYLLIANLLISLASTVFGVVSVVRPAIISKASGEDPGEIFYSRMYAARAISFGLLAAFLPFVQGGLAVATVLFIAALTQVLDACIGLLRWDLRQVAGPLVATAVHVLCGLEVLRYGLHG